MLGDLRNDTLVELCLRVVETLGRHSVTVRELKRLFSLLRAEQPGDFRPRHSDALVRALHNMAERNAAGPARFFVFDGVRSTLRLPRCAVRRFPDARGLSFAVWLRVGALPEAADAHAPRLLSMLQHAPRAAPGDVHGLELLVSARGSLLVRSLHGGNDGSPRAARFDAREARLVPERWQHVVLTHSNQERLPWGKSELRLYVDGVCVGKAPLKYVTFAELDDCAVGANVPLPYTLPSLGLRERHSFDGQLGGVYLFDEALTADEVERVYALGPDYAGTFRDADVLERTARLFVAYHCSGTTSELDDADAAHARYG